MKRYFLQLALLTLALSTAEGRAEPSAQLTYKDVDKQPQIVSATFPGYKKDLTEGKTLRAVVALVVSDKGKVLEASVLATDDVPLGKASIDLMPKWTFKAAVKDKRKVSCATVVQILVQPAAINRRDGSVTRACRYDASLFAGEGSKRLMYFEDGSSFEIFGPKK